MKKLVPLGILFCVIAVTSAWAGDEKEDRWKISFSGVVVGPGMIARPIMDATFRADDGIRSWRRDFYYGYLFPNTDGLLDKRVHDFFLERIDVLCCANNEALLHARDFRGQVGDIYRLWGRRRLNGFEERGLPLGASLEYRMVGNLWGAFTFAMSKETVAKVSETSEFVRVTSIRRFMAHQEFNFSHPVPYWRVNATRHRREREQEHKLRSFQFAFLAKYDLTKSNPHWSVLPQAGVDLLLIRQNDWTEETLYDWRIFSGEYHPSSWAQTPKKVDEHSFQKTTWHEQFRPVAGLTIELWPGGKESHVGFVVDGRYYFNPSSFKFDYESYPAPFLYRLKQDMRTSTLSLGGIIRF